MGISRKKIISIIFIFVFIVSIFFSAQPVHAASKLATPKITVKTVYDGIKIEFAKIDYAKNYTISRKQYGQTAWTNVKTTTSTSFTDTNILGTTYTYKVVANPTNSSYLQSYASNEGSATYHYNPQIKSVTYTKNGLNVVFDPASYKTVYIFRATGKDKNTLKQIAKVSARNNNVAYLDSNVKSDETYSYVAGKSANEYSEILFTIKNSQIIYNSPKIIGVKNAADGPLVSFRKPSGANKCKIFRLNARGKWASVGTTTEDSYVDKSRLVTGTTYTYTVRCVDDEGQYISTYDEKGKSTKWYPQVGTPTVENYATGQMISWPKISGVPYYGVFVKNNLSQSWQGLGFTNKNSYHNANVSDGKQYWYVIRPADSSKQFLNSDYKNIGSFIFHAAPQLTSAENVNGGQKITWKRISGVNYYRLFVRTSSNENWRNVTDVGTSSYTNTNVSNNKTYYYTIRGVDYSGKFITGYNSYKTITYYYAPTLKNVENTSSGQKITWNSVPGISKYRVYYKTNNNDSDQNWINLGTVNGTTLYHNSLKSNQMYCYTVRCTDNKGNNVSSYTGGMYLKFVPKQSSQSSSSSSSGSSVSYPSSTSNNSYDKTFHQKVVNKALSYCGKVSYSYGSANLDGGTCDCSGFVCAVYDKCGYNIWGSRSALRTAGRHVSYSNAVPGDIVVFLNNANDIYSGYHVGIYIGNGMVCDCGNGGVAKRYIACSSSYLLIVRPK